MPRSLQIFRINMSSISVWRGTEERRFSMGFFVPGMSGAFADKSASVGMEMGEDGLSLHKSMLSST